MTATAGEIRVGSRVSALARWQTERVLERLRELDPARAYTFVGVKTAGDASRRPLYEEGGEGVFTGALEEALVRRELDLAVHSYKDVPLTVGAGLAIGAVLLRGDVRDVVIGRPLAELPAGARVGTSSPRRAAAVRAVRPDLVVVPVRGNVPRRIGLCEKGEVDAVILAAAGVERLGLWDRVAEVLPLDRFLPAPAQGAIAVEGRVGDMPAALRVLDDGATRRAVTAERALLARLGGGCGLPLGALATCEGTDADGPVHLRACAWQPEGRRVACAEAVAATPDDAAEQVFQSLVRQGVQAWWTGAK